MFCKSLTLISDPRDAAPVVPFLPQDHRPTRDLRLIVGFGAGILSFVFSFVLFCFVLFSFKAGSSP